MANKLPWFTHDHNARNDEFIARAEDRFGHFGYSAYFKLLEVIHEHAINGILTMSKSRLATNLRSRWPQTKAFLEFAQEQGKIEFYCGQPVDNLWITRGKPVDKGEKSGRTLAEPWLNPDSSPTSDRLKMNLKPSEVRLKNKKFIIRQSKMKSKTP